MLRREPQKREQIVVHEHASNLSKERWVILDVCDDVDLVEDDGRVQNVEGRVVDGTRKHDVFEELQSVSMVDLLLDGVVPDGDGLMEVSGLTEKFAVVGLVVGEFWVVCTVRLDSGDVHELG